jgi:hypothetical protein
MRGEKQGASGAGADGFKDTVAEEETIGKGGNFSLSGGNKLAVEQNLGSEGHGEDWETLFYVFFFLSIRGGPIQKIERRKRKGKSLEKDDYGFSARWRARPL